jgi:hypothetical protein
MRSLLLSALLLNLGLESGSGLPPRAGFARSIRHLYWPNWMTRRDPVPETPPRPSNQQKHRFARQSASQELLRCSLLCARSSFQRLELMSSRSDQGATG